jgi:hypothetical protein
MLGVNRRELLLFIKKKKEIMGVCDESIHHCSGI